MAEDSWALDISFKATKGIGFREIWYLELSERQLHMKHAWAPRLEQPPLDPQFTGLFSAPNDTIDLSSLHWAITDLNPDTGRAEECNIHIDQVGITASLGSGVSVTPDLVYHTLVEPRLSHGVEGLFARLYASENQFHPAEFPRELRGQFWRGVHPDQT